MRRYTLALAFLAALAAVMARAPDAYAQATATPTNTPTPTANVGGLARVVRNLNDDGMDRQFKLGDFLLALYDGRQSGGVIVPGSAAAKYDVAVGTYMIRGVYLSATAGDELVMPATVNTIAAQFRKGTVCINGANTYRIEPGAVAASQATALKPACSDSETEVGYIEFPASFTATSSTDWVPKQDPTRASRLHFP